MEMAGLLGDTAGGGLGGSFMKKDSTSGFGSRSLDDRADATGFSKSAS